MSKHDKLSMEERVRGDMYGMETMKWYGWGSPIGLGIGLALLLCSFGLCVWLLHLADVIK